MVDMCVISDSVGIEQCRRLPLGSNASAFMATVVEIRKPSVLSDNE